MLLDFWATWCGPCREYLPHLQKIAQQFQGQPLVVLSVSLDKDDAAWRAYVAKHDMTWPQYRDGYWNGSMAHMFGIREIRRPSPSMPTVWWKTRAWAMPI